MLTMIKLIINTIFKSLNLAIKAKPKSKQQQPQYKLKTKTLLEYRIGQFIFKKTFDNQYKAKHYFNWLKEENKYNKNLHLIGVNDVVVRVRID